MWKENEQGAALLWVEEGKQYHIGKWKGALNWREDLMQKTATKTREAGSTQSNGG